MSIPSYRSGEPLYTVIYRADEAKTRLQKWCGTSKSIQAKVEDHRLHIYDNNTLSLFVVTWTHSWDNVLVWDTFNKRHVFF